ncbi:DUF222 domain-containing protein [Schumannella luteola]
MTSSALTALRELLDGVPSGADGVVAVEEIGRVVDAARVRVAGGLDAAAAEALGFASPVAAVATLARVSEKTARARLTVAAVTRVDRSLTGAEVPARLPVLAASLERVGLDGAELITRQLGAVQPHVEAGLLAATERVLVNLASGLDASGSHPLVPESVTSLAGQFSLITAAIDPDGARPREERARRRRSFRAGSPDADGLVPVAGLLMPEVGSVLLGLMEAHRRTPRFTENPEPADDDPTDTRTPEQRRHDTLATIIAAAARAADAPTLDGMPVTVVVTTTLQDLADEDGRAGDPIGTMAGSPVPVSRASIERFIDNNGFRVVTLTATGAAFGISTPKRCFIPTQRLMIAARDGNRCSVPGCTSPHYALQVHHVIPWRHGGPTHTNNGILLCYWHHHTVDTGPWKWRMTDGLPEIRGPGIPDWTPIGNTARRIAAA